MPNFPPARRGPNRVCRAQPSVLRSGLIGNLHDDRVLAEGGWQDLVGEDDWLALWFGQGGAPAAEGARSRVARPRCLGTVGGWCHVAAVMALAPLGPWGPPPRGSKDCPSNCSGVGNCNYDLGTCDCPAGGRIPGLAWGGRGGGHAGRTAQIGVVSSQAGSPGG